MNVSPRLSIFLASAMLAGSLAVPARAAAPVCTQCDRKLDLNEAEWRCLRSQLPRLQSSKTRFVFFSLGGQQCAAAASQRTRNSDTRLPPSKSAAARVFRLTSDQIGCVARNAGRIASRSSRYVVDFNTLCPETLGAR